MDNLTEKELLNYAIENGIIDINTIQKQIEMNERYRYIEMHESKVWQSTDGNWYTYLPDIKSKNGRKLIKRKTETGLYDSIVEHYKGIENEPYIETVFDEWVSKKLSYGEIQKQSYDRYKTDFDRFFKDTRIANTKFRYITEEMLEDFIKSTIHDKELTSKSWSGCRTLLNGIFKYAKKKGYTDISITSFMGDLDISKKSFKKRVFTSEESVFTDNEVLMISEYIQKREPTIIELGVLLTFETGLRVGELSAIKWSDVDGYLLNINKREVHYRGDDGKYIYEIVDEAKTDAGTRKVILSENAQRLLKQIRTINPFGEYVFMKNGKRIRGACFTRRLLGVCKSLNITQRSEHKARKTYATKLLDAGLNDRLVISQMGHTQIETTRKHYYFNNKNIEQNKKQIEEAIKYG